MYQLSRRLYRELAPHIAEERPSCQHETNRERVLRGCECTMERLVNDRRHFAKPARTLFNDVRIYFPLAAQLRVYLTIQRHVELALDVIDRIPEEELGVSVTRTCQAMTRKGRPCQRPPLPRSEYCPSHQHLTETFEEFAELPELEVRLAA